VVISMSSLYGTVTIPPSSSIPSFGSITNCHLSKGLNIQLNSVWKVAGALVDPNGNTIYL
jgi:hypothetical protein